MKTFIKHANAIKDYGFDVTKWLAGDTIESRTWSVPAGLTKGQEIADGPVSVVFLGGGEVDKTYLSTYLVSLTITTAGGRTEVFPFRLRII